MQDDELPGKPASYWIDSATADEYPSLAGEQTVDVAVIGAGIVGVTTAFLLKQAGLKVALIEADRVARGVTGRTTAKITSLHRLIYAKLIGEYGEERARLYGEANQDAIDEIERIVGTLGIDCDFVRLPFSTFAETDEDRTRIDQEVDAAQRLGLPAVFEGSVPLPITSAGAVRFEHQAQFHPVRYLDAVARTIPGDGSGVYEHSRVTAVEEGAPCRVSTDAGIVRSTDVVIATHFPIADMKGLYFARIFPDRHYVLAVRLHDPFPRGMYAGAGEDGYAYRTAPTAGGELLIVTVGAHHKTGQGEDSLAYYRDGIEFAFDRLQAQSVDYHWSTQDTRTQDLIPLIGKYAQGSKHLFIATGMQSWGMTNGTVAARIVTDLILRRENPWSIVFDPGRRKPFETVPELLKENLNVGKAFIGGRLSVSRQDLAEIKRGDGRVIRTGGAPVAIYRDEMGHLHGVDPACSHMGCLVSWNNAERSWDCPCHGSRFSPTGEVLQAPAVQNLKRVELTEGGA
jgi:glycine/D-amino acid oxidase-like deaminating enzyme/nitrite reductase/ring-hydroxylating ferredoxin subunit